MKTPLAATLLILAIFGAAGWCQHAAIRRLNRARQALVCEASSLGLRATNEANGGTRHRSAEHPRIDRQAEARSVATDMIDFINNFQDLDETTIEKASGIIDRLYGLNIAQFRILLEALGTSSDIDDSGRGDLLCFAISCLADSRPEAAVTLCIENREMLEIGGRGDSVLRELLGSWGEKDPLAAVDWLRNNGARFPNAVTDYTKLDLIAGSATKAPKLAFQLIAELEVEDKSAAAARIVGMACTPEDQHVMFACLRDLAKAPSADQDSLLMAFRTFATGMAEQGYDATSIWLDAVKPSQEECAMLASGLDCEKTKADSGKWLEWMGKNLPPEKLGDKVLPLMTDWTNLDYHAAGEWLSNVPACAVRTLAVAAYAKTISPYEPAIAAQWAETLPAGTSREDLLCEIHSAWTKVDTDAADTFAKKHGINP